MLTPQQIKEIEAEFDDGFREQLSVVEADMIKSFIITTINNILAERDKGTSVGRLTISDKPEKTDEKCDSCGEKNVWTTNYIGMFAPNRKCRGCNKEWTVSPKAKLEIINIK